MPELPKFPPELPWDNDNISKDLASKLARYARGEQVYPEEIKQYFDPNELFARKKGSKMAVYGFFPAPGGDAYKIYLTPKAMQYGSMVRDAYDLVQSKEIDMGLEVSETFTLDPYPAQILVHDEIITRKITPGEYRLRRPLGIVLYTLAQCGIRYNNDIEPPIDSPGNAASFNKILLDLFFVLGNGVYRYNTIHNYQELERRGYLVRV